MTAANLFSCHNGNLLEVIADNFKEISRTAEQVALLVKCHRKSKNTVIILDFMQIFNDLFAADVSILGGLVNRS